MLKSLCMQYLIQILLHINVNIICFERIRWANIFSLNPREYFHLPKHDSVPLKCKWMTTIGLISQCLGLLRFFWPHPDWQQNFWSFTHMLSFISHVICSIIIHTFQPNISCAVELSNKLMFYIMPRIPLSYWALCALISIRLFGSCLPFSNVYTFILWRLWECFQELHMIFPRLEYTSLCLITIFFVKYIWIMTTKLYWLSSLATLCHVARHGLIK